MGICSGSNREPSMPQIDVLTNWTTITYTYSGRVIRTPNSEHQKSMSYLLDDSRLVYTKIGGKK